MSKLYRWLPAIIVMLIIFLFSSQPYGDQNLKPGLDRNLIVNSLAERMSDVQFDYAGKEVSVHTLGKAGFVEFLIRKGAHFSIFGLLGFTLFYSLHTMRRRSTLKPYIIAVVISFLYACSDEFHQSITPDRTPLFQDVLIDTAGAICGAALMVLLMKWSRQRQKSQDSRWEK